MGSASSTQAQPIAGTSSRPQTTPNVGKTSLNGAPSSAATASTVRVAPRSAAPGPRQVDNSTSRPSTEYQRKQLPPPVPPTKKKADIFHEDDYQAVDNYVLNGPKRLLLGSFKDLITYLTKNSEWDEMSKLRAIFRWVTAVDVYSLRTDMEPPVHSPLEYFFKIQRNMGNHAHLISGLCQMAGIPCVIISGMNKSAAYEIGVKVDRKAMGAQWNGVFIKDEWRFIDAFWASACVVGKKSGEWKLVDTDGNVSLEEEETSEGETQHRINEFYFLPDPDKFIWTHFPDEPQWQLLPKTVSVKDFESRVYVRERFHYLNMSFNSKSQDKCVLYAKGGEIQLPFTLPKETSEHLRYKYMLYLAKSSDEDQAPDIALERFCLFEHTTDTLRFTLRFPRAGKFKMDVFGLDVRESDIFDLTCTYVINCTEPMPNCMPLPDCPDIGWGPGMDAKEAGIVTKTHDGAVIITKDGDVEIKLGTNKDIRLYQLLKNAIVDEATLSKYAVIREENGEYVVNIRLPQVGEYALKLYANDLGEEGDAPNVLNYLIRWDQKDGQNASFPNVTDGFIGKSAISDKLGVKAISHPGHTIDPKIGVEKIVFSAKNNVELLCELHSNDPTASRYMKVVPSEENGQWVFYVDMPIAGEYSMNVFARSKKDSCRIYNVHSYLLHSKGHSINGSEKIDDTKSENSDIENSVDTITETVRTSDNEVVIPIPKGNEEVVACVTKRHASDPPKDDEVQILQQEGRKFLQVKLKEFGEYMIDMYTKDDKNILTKIARYQVNRRTAAELYEDDTQHVIEALRPETEEEDLTLVEDDETNFAPEANDDDKRKRAARKLIQRGLVLKDTDMLEKGILQYESLNPESNDDLLMKGRKMLQILKAKQELEDTSRRRELSALEAAIKRAQEVNYDSQLDLPIALACRLRDQLKRIEKLRSSVLKMDSKTIAELKKYVSPPLGIHQTLQSAFVLLGFTKKEVKDWRSCANILGRMGRESIMRKISLFDPKDVYLEDAMVAKKILEPFSFEVIRDSSAGAATFYVWAKGMIDMVESTGGAVKDEFGMAGGAGGGGGALQKQRKGKQKDEKHGNKTKQGKQKFNRENSIMIPTAQMDEDETSKKHNFNNLNSKEKQAFNRIFQMGGLERQNSIVAGHRNTKKLSISREPSMLKSRGGLVTSTPISTKHAKENLKNQKAREHSTLKSETVNERQNSVLAKNSEVDNIANKPVIEKQRLQRENSTLKPDTAFERQNSILVKSSKGDNTASNVPKEKQGLQREHSRLNSQPALERQTSELNNNNNHRKKGKKQKQKHTREPPAINQIAPVERENSIIVRIGGQTGNNSNKRLKPPKIKKARSIRSLQSEVIVETPNPVRLEDWATAIYNQSERQKAVQRVGPWMHIFKKLKIPNPFKPKANSRNSRKSFRSYKTI